MSYRRWARDDSETKAARLSIGFVNDAIVYLSEHESRLATAHFDPVQTVSDALIQHSSGANMVWRAPTGSARTLAVLGYLQDPLGVEVLVDTTSPCRHTGLVLLFDRETGHVCAAIAAGFLNALRSASVTIAAARRLARPDMIAASVIGAGTTGRLHAEMLAQSFSGLATIAVYDQSPDRARDLCERLADPLARQGVAVNAVDTFRDAILGADLVVLSAATRPSYVEVGWFMSGAMVVLSPDDIGGDLVHRADLLIVDDWAAVTADPDRQLSRMTSAHQLAGPHGPARAGARKIDAELGEVFRGVHPGRQRHDDVIVVCTAGLAAQDIALAVQMRRVALETGLGARLAR